jgi:hypothetical protein
MTTRIEQPSEHWPTATPYPGRYEMIENRDYYPGARYPQQVADPLLPLSARGSIA